MMPDQSTMQERELPNQGYRRLYAQTLPGVTRHVCQNSGSETEAKDVFQDALLILVRNQRRPGFRLTVEPGTYVYAVATRLWLKRLRQRRVRAEKQALVQIHLETSAAEQEAELPTPSAIKAWIGRTSPHCQRVLNALYVVVEPIESVMMRMGWKNRRTARNLKYKCLEQMRRLNPKPNVEG